MATKKISSSGTGAESGTLDCALDSVGSVVFEPYCAKCQFKTSAKMSDYVFIHKAKEVFKYTLLGSNIDDGAMLTGGGTHQKKCRRKCCR